MQNKSSTVAEMGDNKHGPKSGGMLYPFPSGGAGSPASTIWPWPRPIPTKWHLDPSNRLATIHQRHRQTDSTERQTGRDRQRSDSVGRTILQTVAQLSDIRMN